MGIQRIKDLEEIPSPYLSGALDEFLDGKLLPVIQTNRGCPFTALSVQRDKRSEFVRRKDSQTIQDELNYISSKLSNLPSEKEGICYIDSNFGMYKEDIDICKKISEIQNKTSWPSYINVATGKNNKERVLEASKIVNGAINLAGSVQTLNEKVQKNIKRSNISKTQILDLAQQSKLLGADSYSELILALPGETKEPI